MVEPIHESADNSENDDNIENDANMNKSVVIAIPLLPITIT